MGRTFCHSTKCLILYHFVLCTWCCFTNHFRRLYTYIYISQLKRYSRACGSWQDFLGRELLLTRRLRNQGFLLIKLRSSLQNFTVANLTWLTAMEYLCHKWPRICSICHKLFPVLSSFMTYHQLVTRLTRWMPLVEQELPTLPEHLSSPPVFSEVHATCSFVLCVSLSCNWPSTNWFLPYWEDHGILH